MARGRSSEDLTTLQMAIVGYQIEKDKIETKIRELQSALKGRRVAVAASGAKPSGGRRELSAAARARIAAAQKKRWAEHRRQKAQAAKAVKVQAAG
jgi:hypothetical protein